MLAKILEEMWVDPDVLEALSEEQKKILFLKMREEQVRRWREREEMEEREGQHHERPKKVSCKHVSWLLGRDGDVSVSIIGEVDELRSSKLLQSLKNSRPCNDNLNIQTVDCLPDRQESPITHVSVDLETANNLSSEENTDSCSADDELKDSSEDSGNETGSSLDNLSHSAPRYRPHFRSSHGNRPLKAQLSGTARANLKDRESVCVDEKSRSHGRVAQLRKAFTGELASTSAPCSKPPIPAKPAHLQTAAHLPSISTPRESTLLRDVRLTPESQKSLVL
ncbi:uncharacterized protein KZ484_025719 isoform 1-T3 [Pholidichthys leucotaenia]